MPKTPKNLPPKPATPTESAVKNRAGVVAFYPPSLYPSSSSKTAQETSAVTDQVEEAQTSRRSGRSLTRQTKSSTVSKRRSSPSVAPDEDEALNAPPAKVLRKREAVRDKSRPYAAQTPPTKSSTLRSSAASAVTLPLSSAAGAGSGAGASVERLRNQRFDKRSPEASTSGAGMAQVDTSEGLYTPLNASIRRSSGYSQSSASGTGSASKSRSFVEETESMEVDAVEQVYSIRTESKLYSDELKATFLGKKYQRVPEARTQASIYLILDTNFLVGSLGLELLKLMDSQKFETVRIKIPHVVFVELDRLKMSVQKPEVITAAKNAISYLNDRIVEKQDGRIIGQSVEDYRRGFHSSLKSNDDHILECFRQQQSSSSKPVILITDDKNLQSRTVISSTSSNTVRNSRQLRTEISDHLNDRSSIFTNFNVNESFDSEEDDVMIVEPDSDPRAPPEVDFSSVLGPFPVGFVQARIVIDVLEKICKIVLEDLLKTHARDRFGKHWIKALETPLPWNSLDVVVDLICQFRTGIFLDIFTREDERLFQNILVAKKGAEKSFGMKEICEMILAVKNLFELFTKRRSQLTLPEQFDQFNGYLPEIGDKLLAISRGDAQGAQQLQERCERFLEIFRHV